MASQRKKRRAKTRRTRAIRALDKPGKMHRKVSRAVPTTEDKRRPPA